MSVALEVGRLAEVHLREHPGRLLRLGVVVGDEAGIEPRNLAFCLEAVLAGPPFGGAQSEMRLVTGDALRLDFLEIDDGNPDH